MSTEQMQAKIERFLGKYNSVELLKQELDEAIEELNSSAKALCQELHTFRGEPIFVDSSELGKLTITIDEDWYDCKGNPITITQLTSLNAIDSILNTEDTKE